MAAKRLVSVVLVDMYLTLREEMIEVAKMTSLRLKYWVKSPRSFRSIF